MGSGLTLSLTLALTPLPTLTLYLSLSLFGVPLTPDPLSPAGGGRSGYFGNPFSVSHVLKKPSS